MTQPTVTFDVYQPFVTNYGPGSPPETFTLRRSYFDIFIRTDSLTPDVYANNWFDGWCLNPLASIGVPTIFPAPTNYPATLYSSIELALLPATLSIGDRSKLDELNWVINQDYAARPDLLLAGGANYGEIQWAMWRLQGFSDASWNPTPPSFTFQTLTKDGAPDPLDVQKIIDDALLHNGFTPDLGQKIGVIMDTGARQPILIETLAAALGDRVWHDLDADGLQDAGEPGIAGATVRLARDINGDGDFADASEILATTTTDAAGLYVFKALTPGLDYSVIFTTPAGFSTASPRQSDGSPPSGLNSDGPVSDVIVLGPGEFNPTIDSGYYNFAEIGDRVWFDADADGLQDAGEVGVGGVPVQLKNAAGTVVGMQLTNPSGGYLFTNLMPGTYSVCFVAPPGLAFTLRDQGGDDGIDSDADTTTGATVPTVLTSGESDRTWDAGLILPPALATLGDRVWEDKDADGQQDPGEPGIPGATVRLYTCVASAPGVLVATTTTDASGIYAFTGLTPGDYIVEFVTPGGTTRTTANVGPDATDSDAGTGGLTGCYTLSPGETENTVDAGFYRPAAIGDRIWIDTDADGLQDAGEPGKSGVLVELYTCVANAPGVLLTTTSTDAAGNYAFTGLKPGDYIVRFVTPAGHVLTSVDIGPNDLIDSDAGALGFTGCYNLESGETDNSVDAGLVQLAALGDRVWEDNDADGLQDPGEPGVPGVIVTLTGGGADGLINGIGDTTAASLTDASGLYQFIGLNPGEQYRVSFSKPAAYISFTRPDAVPPGTDGTDSDANPAGVTPIVTLAPGQYNDTIDAGLVRPATIGDFVWRDGNGNGVQDAGEPGVPGVTVTLSGTDLLGNAVSRTTTTSGSGLYLFNGSTLLPGTYKVTFSGLPAGLAYTAVDLGGDDTRDSDADPSSGMTPTVTVGSGGINLTLDAGLVGTGIDVIKRVNGDDANTATGPVLVVGSTATFTYEVRNTGNVALAAVALRDDNGTPGSLGDDFTPAFTGGDSNANSRLDLGEVWTYSAARTVLPGQYTNIATTTGTPVHPSGTPVPGLTPPTDDDPANYFGESRDFGDLPSPLYSGVLGAHHVFANQSLRIGASNTDAEPAAQPNATATGDDLGGSDDESGVSLPASIVAGLTTTFNVNATNTSGAAATLYGFVDWNRDGDFLDANEAASAPLANGFVGSVPLVFNVPASAITGQDLGARFRISNTGGLGATGNSSTGEVEDYLVQATAPAPARIDLVKTARIDVVDCPDGPIGGGNDGSPGTPGVQPVAGIELGGLTDFLMFFANGSVDANWQGATKGFAGDVAIDGLQARERTSGGVPFAGTIYTNDTTLGAWQGIVDQNPGQAFGATGRTSLIADLETDLVAAFQQINALPATAGYTSRASTSLNGLNTQNGVNETFVINVTSGLSVSSKINITGDAGDVFVMRWDSDASAGNGYQGQVKFQSGGAIVPLGGLQPGNFIHVAGDMNASGGGSTPAAPYPQGPRLDDGQGSLVNEGKDFSGGGFFTGYWLSTGKPTTLDPSSGLYIGETSPFSNGIFVGGWYTLSSKFSMTSGTSGVHVCPNLGTLTNILLEVDDPFDPNNIGVDGGTAAATIGDLITFTFKVTNTGSVPLSNVKVGDDNTTPGNLLDDYFAAAVLKANGRNFGDGNDNGLLDAAESWYFQAKDYATSVGSFVNTATVYADHAGGQVIDTDVALVGVTP